jgi:hypothetical protein
VVKKELISYRVESRGNSKLLILSSLISRLESGKSCLFANVHLTVKSQWRDMYKVDMMAHEPVYQMV